jgi:hypothetical protein
MTLRSLAWPGAYLATVAAIISIPAMLLGNIPATVVGLAMMGVATAMVISGSIACAITGRYPR